MTPTVFSPRLAGGITNTALPEDNTILYPPKVGLYSISHTWLFPLDNRVAEKKSNFELMLRGGGGKERNLKSPKWLRVFKPFNHKLEAYLKSKSKFRVQHDPRPFPWYLYIPLNMHNSERESSEPYL